MKTIIAGSRSATYRDVLAAIDACPFRAQITSVADGKAPGADTFGRLWARANRITVCDYPAKWSDLHTPGAIVGERNGRKYNKRAGFDRNQRMADDCDALISVWDGQSSGSADMLQRAAKAGLTIFVYNFITRATSLVEGGS